MRPTRPARRASPTSCLSAQGRALLKQQRRRRGHAQGRAATHRPCRPSSAGRDRRHSAMTRRVAGPLRRCSRLVCCCGGLPLRALPRRHPPDRPGRLGRRRLGRHLVRRSGRGRPAAPPLAALLTLVCGVPLRLLAGRAPARAPPQPIGFIVQLPLALPPLTSGVLLLVPICWAPTARSGQWEAAGAPGPIPFAGIVLAETFVAAPFLIVARALGLRRAPTRCSRMSPPRLGHRDRQPLLPRRAAGRLATRSAPGWCWPGCAPSASAARP